MVTNTKILQLAFVLVISSTHTCVKETDSSYVEKIETTSAINTRPVNADKKTFEKNSKITRAVLITHCGSCHQSSLDSHQPEAIKIFDLDLAANWHISLSKENLSGIANRTQNKSAITTAQKEAITTFLQLKEQQLKQ